MSKPVILTGLRANGEFHLGNYLGAIKSVVGMQKKHSAKYQINMFVPDLHSFTTPIDHSNLYQQTLDNLRVFVASGLDIDDPDTYIYRQSYVPAHSELTWILDCFTYYGELSRMTQFKDKSKQPGSSKSDEANVSVGLFNYPVLMAADILLYGAEFVPVGDDQRQHLELTRDLAIRINNAFGEVFVVPHEWNIQLELNKLDRGVRIRSLRNPSKKMSKSIDDPSGTILLSESPKSAAKKVLSAETDSHGSVNYDWTKQPGITNLLQILALLSDKSQEEVNAQWVGSTSYGDLKKAVAECVSQFLTDLQKKLENVSLQSINRKLEKDEKHINSVANQRLLIVQQKVGLRP